MTLPGPYYHIICQVKLTLPEASCEVGSLKYRVLRGMLGAGFLFSATSSPVWVSCHLLTELRDFKKETISFFKIVFIYLFF